MRKHMGILAVICAAAFLSTAAAQPREGNPQRDPGRERAKDADNSSIVTQMMAFDKDKTGKLTKEMVTDRRLHRLFDEADANKDGVVTKEELQALATKMEAEQGPGGERPGPGRRGPGEAGPDGGNREGPGRRGPGGFEGPPHPGQIMSQNAQEALKLTAEQKKQIEDLHKEIDAKLTKILTEEQKKQFMEMRPRGPGGFGQPGGRRAPEGPPAKENPSGRKGPDGPPAKENPGGRNSPDSPPRKDN